MAKKGGEITFPVEAGNIMLFARSIGDANPVYSDADKAAQDECEGIIAPPTFVMSSAQYTPGYPLRPAIGKPWFGSGKTPSGLMAATGDSKDEDKSGDDKKDGGNAGMLHAEQHFIYHQPVRPGDVLSAISKPGETWEKMSKRAGKLLFSETITEYRNQKGELSVTARSVGVKTEKIIQN